MDQTRLFKRLLPYFKPYRFSIILAVISGIIGGLATILTTYYIGKSIDQMIGKNNVHFQKLFQLMFFIALFYLLTMLTQWLVNYFANILAYQSVRDLREQAFNKINHLSLRFFDETSHGDIQSRFTNDLDFISESIIAIFNAICIGMVTVILALIMMLYLSPILTLVVLITTPLMFLVTWSVARASQKNFVKQQTLVGQISGFISEHVGNQKTIKIFQQEGPTEVEFEVINQRLNTVGQNAQFASSLTNPLSRFVDHLGYIAIGVVGGWLMLSGRSTSVTIGIISSFIIYSSQFTKPFIDLSGVTTQIQTAMAGVKRIFEVMDQPAEIRSTSSRTLQDVKGQISWKKVSFSYTPHQKLIENFNLEVAPGQTIAIVGQTGAGKSTLVNLLMRFYDVTSGQISIDGEAIQNFTKDSLRQAFGMVLQESWLFEGTIADNLKFGRPEATDEEMIHAAKEARIDHFIASLPDGYQSVLGQSGVEISEGQRQLLTIARVMIAKPPMLILDEATSSVDTLTEARISNAFNTMMKNKTSFIIAHRLSTIKNADLILVMAHGEVVEQGTHSVLLEKNGAYAQLLHAQFAE